MFIYKRCNIECRAENDIRGSLSAIGKRSGMMFPYEIENLLNMDGLQNIDEILDRLLKVRDISRDKVRELGFDIRSVDLDNLPLDMDKEKVYWISFYKNLFNFISIPLFVNDIIDQQEIASINFDEHCKHDIAEILTSIEMETS